MEPRFDIHLHLFNKTFLAKELYFRLIQVIHQLFDPEEKRTEKGLFDSVAQHLDKIRSVLETIKRINHFLHAGFQANSTEVCNDLNEVYKNEFILTPLMFDLTYCFVTSAQGTKGLVPKIDYFAVLDKQKKKFMKNVGTIAPPAEKGMKAFPVAGKKEQQMMAELEKEMAEFDRLTKELRKSGRKDDTRQKVISKELGGLPGEADGFYEQIRQLQELKERPKYKNRIFPFLAVDPRRPGILQYMKENTGKGKPFIGVKIYSPNGYSPTDPLLYGSPKNNDCVYAFCEKNGIPVTAHNSFGGFATFMDSVEVTGDVYTSAGIKYYDKKILSFKTKLLSGAGKAIKERALALNHPSLWEKVLQKYPKLYLDLAHFGGGERLGFALDKADDPESDNWSQKIIDLIGKYPNAFTDISCYSDFDVLRKLRSSAVYQKIRAKIMYGSDYYLLLLFENDFRKNIANFRSVFAGDFDLISIENPGRYLGNVLL